MFRKKKCPHCKEKISETYNFCPYCRAPLTEESDGEDWGMLGKNDFIPGAQDKVKLPFGFNMLFNSLLKNLNNQFNELEKQNSKPKTTKKSSIKKGGISISISTSNGKPPEIKVSSFGKIPKQIENKQLESTPKKLSLPNSSAGKFAGLPKQEPETNVRRLSNKVVYEVKLPGVKSVKDVSIAQFENSIEIKALAKDKVFSKIIPINLPIKNYNLSKGKLTLELDARE